MLSIFKSILDRLNISKNEQQIHHNSQGLQVQGTNNSVQLGNASPFSNLPPKARVKEQFDYLVCCFEKGVSSEEDISYLIRGFESLAEKTSDVVSNGFTRNHEIWKASQYYLAELNKMR